MLPQTDYNALGNVTRRTFHPLPSLKAAWFLLAHFRMLKFSSRMESFFPHLPPLAACSLLASVQRACSTQAELDQPAVTTLRPPSTFHNCPLTAFPLHVTHTHTHLWALFCVIFRKSKFYKEITLLPNSNKKGN